MINDGRRVNKHAAPRAQQKAAQSAHVLSSANQTAAKERPPTRARSAYIRGKVKLIPLITHPWKLFVNP